MNTSQVLEQTKTKLNSATEHFKQETSKIRTGRAHPSMLDGVMVEAYGQAMPLKAVATVAAPEAQLLQISPFDTGNITQISAAIRDNQSLNMNPADDGRVIRIQIPPLTTETRQQMVKILGQKLEECLISARQIRHDALRQGEDAEKAREISKDDRTRFEKQVDELAAKQKTDAESLAKDKEKEIMTV